MRALFIGHGSPTIAIEKNQYTDFLKELGKGMPKPKAIVIFTAHWESEVLTISDVPGKYETIYDFGGFNEELYQIKYPARGHAQYVKQMQEALSKHNIPFKLNKERGLDHGSWVPLHLMFPAADIPVIQCTVNAFGTVKEHYGIGKALSELADEDILVIGSGGTVHNLMTLNRYSEEVEQWAVAFDDWLLEQVDKWDVDSLQDYESLAPYARYAVPRQEHFLPFFIPMGCGHEQKEANVLHRWYYHGTLSHLCMEFKM